MIRTLDILRSLMAHITTAVVAVAVAVVVLLSAAPWESYTDAASRHRPRLRTLTRSSVTRIR